MDTEEKLNILEQKIKNKIASQQEHSTYTDFDEGFIQAMNRGLYWIAKLKTGLTQKLLENQSLRAKRSNPVSI